MKNVDAEPYQHPRIHIEKRQRRIFHKKLHTRSKVNDCSFHDDWMMKGPTRVERTEDDLEASLNERDDATIQYVFGEPVCETFHAPNVCLTFNGRSVPEKCLMSPEEEMFGTKENQEYAHWLDILSQQPKPDKWKCTSTVEECEAI